MAGWVSREGIEDEKIAKKNREMEGYVVVLPPSICYPLVMS